MTIQENLYDIRVGKDILNKIRESINNKKIINNFDYIQIKNFLSSKVTTNKMKKITLKLEKYI